MTEEELVAELIAHPAGWGAELFGELGEALQSFDGAHHGRLVIVGWVG